MSKGTWIIDDSDIDGKIYDCHCSNCKKDPQYFISGSEIWWADELPNYCPFCGSKNELE